VNAHDIIWDGDTLEPHVYPAPTAAELRRDRMKAWLAHQPFVHRLLDVALLGALPGVGAYARFVAPHTVETTEHMVPVIDLPPALDGLRIAHLSDIHLGKNVPERFVSRSFELTMKSKPDLVVMTGDYLQWDPGYIDILGRLLANLHAPLGVYAVLGNHDYGLNSPAGVRFLDHAVERLVRTFAGAGVQVLRNESVVVSHHGEPLTVIGVDDLWSGECDPVSAFSGVSEKGPRIFLCHNPDGYGYRDRGYAFDVMLAGHTHGAQVRLSATPKALLPVRDARLCAGYYGRRGGWVYVNRGLGYIWQVRFNSAPEIAFHTLRREITPSDRPLSVRRRRERWKR